MTINIAAGETVTLKTNYLDKLGNVSYAPEGSGELSWTNNADAVGTLDTTSGPTVTLTATGAIGASGSLTVTDGVLVSAGEYFVVVAGPPASLAIQQA